VVHIDVTEPYCPQLRDVLYDAGVGPSDDLQGRLCLYGRAPI
jgi:purine nucleoside phosphorylase